VEVRAATDRRDESRNRESRRISVEKPEFKHNVPPLLVTHIISAVVSQATSFSSPANETNVYTTVLNSKLNIQLIIHKHLFKTTSSSDSSAAITDQISLIRMWVCRAF